MIDEEKLFTTLSELVLTPGVSGDEWRVADVIERHLLAAGFTADDIQSDYIGNRWIQLGPPGEPQRLLVAHMDEIGQRIASIRPDGYCTLHPIGGSDPQLWEGTPVVVHTPGGAVPGCIAPVSHHTTFGQGLAGKERLAQRDLLLDVGANNPEEVAALGVSLLDPVTWPKAIARCANDVVQARSLDDRFGCCALLLSAVQLRQQPPAVPTVIAWSTQEEVGLRGARVLAHHFSQCREVIAIDSFCTGAGPRDSKLWTSAVFGRGPVLRSWDLTTLVPDTVRQQLLRKAAALGIELQYGYMSGGNDASQFEFTAACVFGLSVCVQYSHTNAERINLLDLAQLTKLIAAWCGTPLQ